jgi:hypothetical protein
MSIARTDESRRRMLAAADLRLLPIYHNESLG